MPTPDPLTHALLGYIAELRDREQNLGTIVDRVTGREKVATEAKLLTIAGVIASLETIVKHAGQPPSVPSIPH